MSTPTPAHDATCEFIGTATTLLRLGPFTVLTDPNFLHRDQLAYLGKGLVSRRRTEPSRDPATLPDLDAVVLSHLHGDHFDRVARRELRREAPVLTTSHAARRLDRWGFHPVAMGRWTTHTLERDGVGLRVTATPGRHAPGPAQALLPPVMGSVLELDDGAGRPFRVYITGDTLYRRSLRAVVDRCGPLDAMVIHLGGTRILGMLVTMDDRQGARLVQAVRPAVTVPVHFDDYGVFRSPRADFERRFARDGLPGDLRLVERGQTVSLVP
ncbi:MBL fold metallo-hydrolase [Arsenicicoccus sp. oral taxon 190]|uniref:MBL fold metallo-hydrolase n=1 Tax=Arsenicicoccus sp. oral taxon 190 TaxID=1658671 RepID=UPI00067A0794|nr:MBL fold metallo-hydrolase [Arsenicicoccus sp. oral taxon 190]AKT50987.1 metal-dependent hydrolase [Arsenicicoccus sp. oral taxon 190]